MADGRGDDKFIVLKEVVLLWNFAESAGKVGGHTWLFSDDESFWQLLNFHKAAAGSCLTSLRISRASNVEETSWVGNPHLEMIASMGVSSSPMDSRTDRSAGVRSNSGAGRARSGFLERANRSRQEYPARL